MTPRGAEKETRHPLATVSIRAAAQTLNTSERRVLLLVERGEIAAHVGGHGGRRRIYRGSLLDYAAKNAPRGKLK